MHGLGNMAPAIKSIESGCEDNTVRVLTHVSPESVTCGVTFAKFGVLDFLCNDCMAGKLAGIAAVRHHPLCTPSSEWVFCLVWVSTKLPPRGWPAIPIRILHWLLASLSVK